MWHDFESISPQAVFLKCDRQLTYIDTKQFFNKVVIVTKKDHFEYIFGIIKCEEHKALKPFKPTLLRRKCLLLGFLCVRAYWITATIYQLRNVAKVQVDFY